MPDKQGRITVETQGFGLTSDELTNLEEAILSAVKSAVIAKAGTDFKIKIKDPGTIGITPDR